MIVYALAGEERGGAVFVRRVVKLDKETDYSKTKGLHRRMLLMSMSHEFRNPVNGIRRNNWEGLLAMLPLLKERLSDPQDQYQVDAIITCAKFLNNYISNWLVSYFPAARLRRTISVLKETNSSSRGSRSTWRPSSRTCSV